jgi:hypothetical protein
MSTTHVEAHHRYASLRVWDNVIKNWCDNVIKNRYDIASLQLVDMVAGETSVCMLRRSWMMQCLLNPGGDGAGRAGGVGARHRTTQEEPARHEGGSRAGRGPVAESQPNGAHETAQPSPRDSRKEKIAVSRSTPGTSFRSGLPRPLLSSTDRKGVREHRQQGCKLLNQKMPPFLKPARRCRRASKSLIS